MFDGVERFLVKNELIVRKNTLIDRLIIKYLAWMNPVFEKKTSLNNF